MVWVKSLFNTNTPTTIDPRPDSRLRHAEQFLNRMEHPHERPGMSLTSTLQGDEILVANFPAFDSLHPRQTSGRQSAAGNYNPQASAKLVIFDFHRIKLYTLHPVPRRSRSMLLTAVISRIFEDWATRSHTVCGDENTEFRLIQATACTDLRRFRTLAFTVLEPSGNPGNLLQILRVLTPPVGCHLLCCLSEISEPVCESGARGPCGWNQRRTK